MDIAGISFFTKLGQRIMHHYSNDTFIISSKKCHYTDYFLVLFAMFFNKKKGCNCIVYLINSKVKNNFKKDKIILDFVIHVQKCVKLLSIYQHLRWHKKFSIINSTFVLITLQQIFLDVCAFKQHEQSFYFYISFFVLSFLGMNKNIS